MKFSWRGVIALALTVGILWWFTTNTDWTDVGAKLAGANIPLMVFSVLLATMIFPLRAARWRPILEPTHPNLPFGPLWRATAIGFMANNLLPSGRVGEFVRPYALSRETGVPYATGFASLIADRVFDAVVVGILTALAMLTPAFSLGDSSVGFLGFGVAFMGLMALGAMMLAFLPEQIIGMFVAIARRTVPRFERRGAEILRSFAEGLAVLRKPRLLLVIAFWAFALWVTQAVAFWLAMKAINIDVPFSAAVFVQGIIVLAVVLPAMPGNFTTFEAAAVLGLGVFGINQNLALAWALTFHLLSLIPITLIGLYYLARSGMNLGELRQLKR
jgi:uncharacterized protein (TIRG00374 family)